MSSLSPPETPLLRHLSTSSDGSDKPQNNRQLDERSSSLCEKGCEKGCEKVCEKGRYSSCPGVTHMENRWDETNGGLHRTSFCLRKNCLVFLVAAGLFLALVALCVSVAVSVTLYKRCVAVETEQPRARGAIRHCRPCRRSVPGEGDASAPAVKNESGQGLCCSSPGSGLETDSQALPLSPTEITFEYLDNTAPVQCAAHVYYESGIRLPITQGQQVVQSWSDRGNSAFLRSCVHYAPETGRFSLDQDGVYTLYSHVTFNNRPRNDTASASASASVLASRTVFTHKVRVELKVNGGYFPNDLLEDTQVITCDDDVTLPCHVSSIVSTMYLRAADRIFVEVSPLELVQGNVRSSYFGFMRMSD